MINGFWKTVIWLTVVALALMLLAGYLFGKVMCSG